MHVEQASYGVIVAVGDGRRVAYAPGSDVTDAPEEVRKIAAATWTDDVIRQYQRMCCGGEDD